MKYVPKPPQTSGSETLGPFNMANVSLILPASRGVRRGSSPRAKSSATRGGAGPEHLHHGDEPEDELKDRHTRPLLSLETQPAQVR